jgi:hypothetical protein
MRDWRKGGSVWMNTREEEGSGQSRRVRKEEVSGGEFGFWWRFESNQRAAALSGKGEERSNSNRGCQCSIFLLPPSLVLLV